MNRDIDTQVVCRDGEVVLLFSIHENGERRSVQIDHLNLAPRAALAAAELISAMAFEADTRLKPVGETLKASLIQKHRDILIPRVSLMLNNLREKRTVSSGQLSEQIITTVFAEIF